MMARQRITPVRVTRWLGGAALAAALLGGSMTGASAQACAGGRAPVGWVGIGGLACNCTLMTGPAPEWSFRSEPRVLSVAAGSRADGVLRAGDQIVAVNGDLITTSEAGRAFGSPRPGAPLRLTVRREGRLVDVEVTPAPICPEDPRAEPATPRGLGVPGEIALPRVAPGAQPPPPASTPRAASPPPTLPRMPAPMAPAAPRVSRHGGWFGFGISCSRCSWEMEEGDTIPRWEFEEFPRLILVEDGSPAHAAGLRTGDELLRIDGVGLRTEEGGRRFGAVRPGQQVRWTYRRDGREGTVDVRATERPVDPELARMATMLDTLAARTRRGERVPADFFRMWETPPPDVAPMLPRTPGPGAFRTVRFHDYIGDVEVEVLGGPSVVTTIVEDGRDVIIDTGDARIRIRSRAREDGQRQP